MKGERKKKEILIRSIQRFPLFFIFALRQYLEKMTNPLSSWKQLRILLNELRKAAKNVNLW